MTSGAPALRRCSARVLVASGIALTLGVAANPDAAAAGVEGCPAQPVTRIAGTLVDSHHDLRPPDNRTYDLRGVTATDVPFTTTDPFVFGEERQSRYLCARGGTVQGSPLVTQMPRTYVKQKYQGHGLHAEGIDGHGYVVDGVRIDNAEDGIGPLGDGFVLRNAYLSNIRDDCVENDFLSAGRIEDSLLDGCYMGLSTQLVSFVAQTFPTSNLGPVVLDRVLMRLKPLPELVGGTIGITHNRLWKGRLSPIFVRDSVLLVEEAGIATTQPFPPGFTAQNVTLVWLGSGPYPAAVPPGVTVTTDAGVWESAREEWLERHGHEPLPDHPSLVRSAESGDGWTRLTWTLGSGAGGYRIKRSVGSGGPYETVAELGPAARSHVDTDVANGTRYFYVASSIGAQGESVDSNEAIAVPVSDDAGVPAMPQNVVATADPTDYGRDTNYDQAPIDLTWNHVAGAEEYVVRQGTQPGIYTREIVVQGNSFTDVSRAAGTTFHYQVVARNRHGAGPPSADVSATPVAHVRTLPAPRFRPAVAGDGRVALSWLHAREPAGDSVYTIKRATAPGGPYEPVASVEDDVVYTDTGLTNGVTYHYVVQVTDGSGSSPSSEEIHETPQAAPVIPDAPSALTASAEGNAVRLEWDGVDLATHYTVARATSADGPFEPLYQLVPGPSYTDYGIEPGRRYAYRVSALNSFGQSAPGPAAEVSVGALDHHPPSVAVTGVEDGADYVIGAVPKPGMRAHDAGGIAARDEELRRPATATGAGRYSYVASARDVGTNESIVHAMFRVRYRFSGFRGPLRHPDRTFSPDEPIPIVFRLTDAHRRPVNGAGYEVLVDGVPAAEWPSGHERAGSGTYGFVLDPRLLSEEMHTLTLRLDDRTAHRTTFRLQRS